jgi:hypothetical protein
MIVPALPARALAVRTDLRLDAETSPGRRARPAQYAPIGLHIYASQSCTENARTCRDEGYGARNRPDQLEARPGSWSCASTPIMNDSRPLAAWRSISRDLAWCRQTPRCRLPSGRSSFRTHRPPQAASRAAPIPDTGPAAMPRLCRDRRAAARKRRPARFALPGRPAARPSALRGDRNRAGPAGRPVPLAGLLAGAHLLEREPLRRPARARSRGPEPSPPQPPPHKPVKYAIECPLMP